MNPQRLLALLLAIAPLPALAGPIEAPRFRLQPRLYVFKNSDFAQVGTEAPGSGEAGRAQVFKAPATIRFDQHTLTLREGEYVWDSGAGTDDPLGRIVVPDLRVRPGVPATLRCAAPAQYMEKGADGALDLREIAADSPEVPRYVLSFLVENGDPGTDDLRVTCRPEIASIRERAKLPEVGLEVGRPQTSVAKDETTVAMHRNEWAAMLFRSPGPGDNSMLALFRISDGPAAPLATAAPAEPATGGTSASAAAGAKATMGFQVEAKVTEEGARAALPAPEQPVRYLAYDGGLSELGVVLAGEKHPSAAEMGTTFRAVLETQGYALATAQQPPAVVLVYHWGSVRDPQRFANASPYLDVREKMVARDAKVWAWVRILAYDFTDLTKGRQTLLWSVDLDSEESDAWTRTLPALIGGSGAFLGRNFARQSGTLTPAARGIDVQLLAGEPFPIPAGLFGPDGTESMRKLIEQERHTLSREVGPSLADVGRNNQTPPFLLAVPREEVGRNNPIPPTPRRP